MGVPNLEIMSRDEIGDDLFLERVIFIFIHIHVYIYLTKIDYLAIIIS